MALAIGIWPFRARPASGISFGKRFHAWWEGYELPARANAAGFSEIDQPIDAASIEENMPFPTPEPGNLWGEERRKLVQMLWGQGLVHPGGVDYACDLVSGFSLNPAVSMVEVGAGLGGGTRAIVEKFKSYVDAFEIDENLAREGMLMSKVRGVNDKAPIQHLDIETLHLKDHYYEGALIRDTLYTVEDKAKLVRKVVRAVKPYCQIVITDLVRASESTGPEVESWMAAEPEAVHLWSVNQAQQCLSSLNVLTRITSDESDDYRARVLGGWTDFLHRIETHPLGRNFIVPLVNEAELWARRIAAIDSGDLRYFRFLGIKEK